MDFNNVLYCTFYSIDFIVVSSFLVYFKYQYRSLIDNSINLYWTKQTCLKMIKLLLLSIKHHHKLVFAS